MLKRMISTLLTVVTLSGLAVVLATTSQAYDRVGAVALDDRVVRLYDRADLGLSGRDGWCYRGAAHLRDWACNVDTSTDRRRFSATVSGNFRFYNYSTKHWSTASASPLWPGQVPLCLPDWYRFGTAYHKDVWAGTNHYLCGFFS